MKNDIEQAVIDLHYQLQDEIWLLDIRKASDDAGYHIEVIVNGYNYPREDPLLRKFNNISVVVIKKNIKLSGEKLV